MSNLNKAMLIHIGVESVFFLGLSLYFSKKYNTLKTEFGLLEEKVDKFEKEQSEQKQLIQFLLNNREIPKELICDKKTGICKLPNNVKENVVKEEIIEEENLDKEIENELSELNVAKQPEERIEVID